MNNPLVSICIPTHNRPHFLKQALKSAQKQTYKTIEIIISDNSDNNITQKYISTLNDKRIRYYRNVPNLDQLLNGILPAQRARGTYIKYLMDDDLLKPNCVKKMVSVLEQYPKVGVVMAPLDIIDEDGNATQPMFNIVRRMKYLYKYKNKDSYVSKEKIMSDFLTSVYPCCVQTGIMYRKSLYRSVNSSENMFRYIDDVDLCMRFATKMDFFYINEFLSSWRYTKTSDTISILHKKGTEQDVFYRLTNKYILYADSQREAYFFASKRTALNILAGIQSKNIPLIFETLQSISRNDPYILNKLYLPFNLLSEVIKSFLSL